LPIARPNGRTMEVPMKTLCFLFALFAAPLAHAGSGSASGSCSGTIEGYGYFYAYTYQYVYAYSGQVQNENHNFNFNGFLEGMDEGQRVGFDGRYVVYRKGSLDLAVPYQSDAGLYFRDNSSVDTPDSPAGRWIKLCDY
jgi:hypothetical protein